MESIFSELLKHLKNSTGELFIQPHDFPDPDAVASAYGLSELLKLEGYPCELLYFGYIQRQALNRMIGEFNIPLKQQSCYLVRPEDHVIIVDGNTGNKNVTPIDAKVSAVIDHHKSIKEKIAANYFIDIRESYGSCSSIISEYWQESSHKPPIEIATSLLIGIARDTDNFKRMISPMDLEQFSYLWPLADHNQYYNIIRNNIENQDRIYYRILMNTMKMNNRLAYVYFPQGCPLGMMGILGDFLLSMNDIDFSLIAASNDKDLNISIRNEREDLSAGDVLQELMDGLGWGGGHAEMAGGIIPLGSKKQYSQLIDRLKNLLS